MATKQVTIDDIGVVTFYKRRGSRSIRISVTHEGKVRVTLPTWVPYQAGINFVRTKTQWINKQRGPLQASFQDGQAIGKAHHLSFRPSTQAAGITSRLGTIQAVVTYPAQLNSSDSRVQKVAQQVSTRALRQQAEALLPQRLSRLAQQFGFAYRSVGIRQLKSRWGSCNQLGDITLSLFLMQLPWELIDYVILHELTHTEHMHHGENFWHALEKVEPNARQLRRTIRKYRPAVIPN